MANRFPDDHWRLGMLTCPHCNAQYDRRNSLLKHIREQHAVVNRQQSCDRCDYTVPAGRTSNLNRHMQKKHSSSHHSSKSHHSSSHHSSSHHSHSKRKEEKHFSQTKSRDVQSLGPKKRARSPWRTSPDIHVQEPDWQRVFELETPIPPLSKEETALFPEPPNKILKKQHETTETFTAPTTSTTTTDILTTSETRLSPSRRVIKKDLDKKSEGTDISSTLTTDSETHDNPAMMNITTEMTTPHKIEMTSESLEKKGATTDETPVTSSSPSRKVVLKPLYQGREESKPSETLTTEFPTNNDSDTLPLTSPHRKVILDIETSSPQNPESPQSPDQKHRPEPTRLIPLEWNYNPQYIHDIPAGPGLVYEHLNRDRLQNTDPDYITPLNVDPRLQYLGAPSLYSHDPAANVLRGIREVARHENPRQRRVIQGGTSFGSQRIEEAILNNGNRYRLLGSWLDRPHVEITRQFLQSKAVQVQPASQTFGSQTDGEPTTTPRQTQTQTTATQVTLTTTTRGTQTDTEDYQPEDKEIQCEIIKMCIY